MVVWSSRGFVLSRSVEEPNQTLRICQARCIGFVMIGYTQKVVFSASEIEYLTRAVQLVEALPSFDSENRWVRCHEITRALAPLLGLTWCDGYYGMVEHSWLWTSELVPFSQPPNILDPYCPGRLPQVQLVHSSANLPYEYRRSAERDDIRQPVVDQLSQVFIDLVQREQKSG